MTLCVWPNNLKSSESEIWKIHIQLHGSFELACIFRSLLAIKLEINFYIFGAPAFTLYGKVAKRPCTPSPSSSESGHFQTESPKRIFARYFNHFLVLQLSFRSKSNLICPLLQKNIIPSLNPCTPAFFPPKGQNWGLTQVMLPLQDPRQVGFSRSSSQL